MKILGKRAGSAQLSTTTAKTRLVILLAIFTTALMIPLGFLANHVYKQFEEEMYYDYRWNAERLVKQANKDNYYMMLKEEERSFSDYQFFKWVSDPLTKKQEKTKSPLAHPKKIKHIPGYLGHFQIDGQDQFSSPLLPYIEKKYLTKKAGMEWDEVSKRLNIQNKIKELLISNNFLQLPKVKPKKTVTSKNDQLIAKQETEYKTHKPRTEKSYMSKDKEKEAWKPDKMTWSEDDYTSFEVEIDPFQLKRSDDGYMFFYRKVWRKNQRYVQGFVVDEHQFLEKTLSPLLAERKFSTDITLQVLGNSNVIKELIFKAGEEGCIGINVSTGELSKSKDLHFSKIAFLKPFDKLVVLFTTKNIPTGPGSQLVDLLLIVVSSVMAIGVFIIYLSLIHI